MCRQHDRQMRIVQNSTQGPNGPWNTSAYEQWLWLRINRMPYTNHNNYWKGGRYGSVVTAHNFPSSSMTSTLTYLQTLYWILWYGFHFPIWLIFNIFWYRLDAFDVHLIWLPLEYYVVAYILVCMLTSSIFTTFSTIFGLFSFQNTFENIFIILRCTMNIFSIHCNARWCFRT